jgi:hypothetical protein
MPIGDIRIEWNHPGFQQVLQSGSVTSWIAVYGKKYTAKANRQLKNGDGYHGDAHSAGRSRWNIYTFSSEAKHDNSANNTLAKLMP